MATCSLCPPGSAAIPDDEMDVHRRAVHPEAGEGEDSTLRVGDSTIVRDASLDPGTGGSPDADEEWRE